jgi:hypothetical protein
MVATVVAAHRQHSAAMTAVMPPGAGLEATLEAVHQLLHNPLGPHASPLAAEQWHHDIDQLIVAAINTSPRGGRQVNHPGGAPVTSVAHSCSPTAPCESSAPHALVASLGMVDLRVKLKRHRSGEDGRITIERHREHPRDLVRTLVRQAAHTPTSPGSGGGCMALAPYLRMVVWPCKF